MEENHMNKSISLQKEDSLERSKSDGINDAKRRRTRSCLSFMEISIDPPVGVKSLKHLDSEKLKNEIKKWAKAVVTYARQVSRRLSSRQSKSFSMEEKIIENFKR